MKAKNKIFYQTVYSGKQPMVGRAMIGKTIMDGELVNFRVDRIMNVALTPHGVIATDVHGNEYQYRPLTDAPRKFRMKRIK